MISNRQRAWGEFILKGSWFQEEWAQYLEQSSKEDKDKVIADLIGLLKEKVVDQRDRWKKLAGLCKTAVDKLCEEAANDRMFKIIAPTFEIIAATVNQMHQKNKLDQEKFHLVYDCYDTASCYTQNLQKNGNLNKSVSLLTKHFKTNKIYNSNNNKETLMQYAVQKKNIHLVRFLINCQDFKFSDRWMQNILKKDYKKKIRAWAKKNESSDSEDSEMLQSLKDYYGIREISRILAENDPENSKQSDESSEHNIHMKEIVNSAANNSQQSRNHFEDLDQAAAVALSATAVDKVSSNDFISASNSSISNSILLSDEHKEGQSRLPSFQHDENKSFLEPNKNPKVALSSRLEDPFTRAWKHFTLGQGESAYQLFSEHSSFAKNIKNLVCLEPKCHSQRHIQLCSSSSDELLNHIQSIIDKSSNYYHQNTKESMVKKLSFFLHEMLCFKRYSKKSKCQAIEIAFKALWENNLSKIPKESISMINSGRLGEIGWKNSLKLLGLGYNNSTETIKQLKLQALPVKRVHWNV